MSLQQVLTTSDPAEVDRFMDLARESHEPQDIYLLEYMVEEGLTPWQASARTAERIGRSPHSLYVRARTLVGEIHQHFGRTAEDWAGALLEEGEITGVPPYLVHEVRKLIDQEGRRFDTLTTLRLREERR